MDLNIPLLGEDLIKLSLAILLGGLIGVERELRDKDAGFRTLIFISSGAALFTIFSLRLSVQGDPGRVAANIVSGVGFLGAGVILRERGQVRGLTTASTVWLAAALGMGVGAGNYVFSILATVVILFILLVFPPIEGWIGRFSETRVYEVVCRHNPEKINAMQQAWRELHLWVKQRKLGKREGLLVCTFEVNGRLRDHEKLLNLLFNDPDVIEFHY